MLKTLVLTLAVLGALAAPARAWMPHETCKHGFWSADHVHEIGRTAQAAVNSLLPGNLVAVSDHGESVKGKLDLVAPFDFAGSFVCLGFRSEPHVQDVATLPPGDCPPCEDERKILLRHHCLGSK